MSYAGNIELIIGTSNQSNVFTFEQQHNASHTLTTPFFPSIYPKDYASEHLIQCTIDNNTTNEACRIRVIFTDFQIALDSTLEVGIECTQLAMRILNFKINKRSKITMVSK